jgi:xanthine dehydrogenase large subunit
VTHYGQVVEQQILPALIERLEASSDYRARREAIRRFNADSPVLRRGIALTPVKFGISFTVKHLNQAGALLHIYTDGSMQINHGGTEMGQGLYTKVAQVVARELQVDIGRIRCTATRTDKVPNTSPTAASSGSDINGMAALNAAYAFGKHASRISPPGISAATRTACVFTTTGSASASREFSFAEFVSTWRITTACHCRPPVSTARRRSTTTATRATGRPFFYYYANGAAVSEVMVDTLTGEYRVTRVDICHDVGDSLNPAIDLGQIEGGFVQGMGWLTSEELAWDERGRLLTLGPATYKIPAVGDAPVDLRVELLPDSPNAEATVFRSKAVGEPPLMLATSVWCALRDAVASLADYRAHPPLDTPATPERVLAACDRMRGAKA